MKTNPNDSITGATIEPAEKGIRVNLTNNLTKREYFAAMAMQGILSGTSGVEALASIHPTDWCESAVMTADALIAELNKGEA